MKARPRVPVPRVPELDPTTVNCVALDMITEIVSGRTIDDGTEIEEIVPLPVPTLETSPATGVPAEMKVAASSRRSMFARTTNARLPTPRN